jgi:hypothetical protein
MKQHDPVLPSQHSGVSRAKLPFFTPPFDRAERYRCSCHVPAVSNGSYDGAHGGAQ